MNRKIILSIIGLGLIVGLAALAQNQGGQQQAQAQQPVPTQPPGAVSGLAVSATTGEPLRKASLALQPVGQGGGSATATTTDNSGAFRFAAVDPGTYRLTGSRTGYVAGTYGQDKPGDQPRQLTVLTGQTTNGIQFKLVPQSVIIGKVFDADGDPVQNAVVQVLRYSYPRGDRQLTTVQTGTTNDIGEYRIAGLQPGRYYVSALGSAVLNNFLNQRGGGAGGGGGGGGNNRGNNNNNNNNANNGRGRGKGAQAPKQQEADQQQENYVVTYYPRSLEPGSANPIDLVPGSEARGVDIGLAKQRQYRIQGSVEGAALSTPQANNQDKNGKAKAKGGGGQGVQVNLVPRGAQPGLNIPNLTGGANANVDPATGRFEFRSVSPGSYYVVAQSRGPGNQQDRLTGRLPVDVGASNLDNISVRMTTPLTVNGTLKLVTPDTSVNMKSVRVAFTPQTNVGGGGGGRGGGNNGRIDLATDGTFTTQLDADAYSVTVTGAPDGYYLKAVKLSSQEAPDAVVNLNFSGAPLEIVLDTGAGTITGSVVNAKGDSPGRVLVTAVPISGSRRTDLNKSTNTADDGSFKMTNLPPGKYKLYAWEQIDQNSWMAPEFRQPFESLGVTGEVSTSGSSPIVLRLIGQDLTTGK